MKKTTLINFKKNFKKGFTLIELLVVIGILGILAAALIATLDPFEQLKKGQDTTIKEMATEFTSANVRYFGTHNAFPWATVANGGAGCNANTAPATVALSTLGTCITALVNDGELKSTFANVASAQQAKIFVTQIGGTNVVSCYLPTSKAQQQDQNSIYTNAGAPTANTNTIGSGKYWCAQ